MASSSSSKGNDDFYFDSYSDVVMQEVMLRDAHRTMAYKKAVEAAVRRVGEDAVVIDVGCGTGILSIFAAKAGARKVYAIDASDIAKLASRIVEENGLSDRVTVVKSTVESLAEEDGLRDSDGNTVKADIIVSEWMGFFLLVENMLPSALVARDKWLKDDGLMLPSRAALYVQPFTDPDIDFWSDVYGVNMECIKDFVSLRGIGPEAIFDTLPDGHRWGEVLTVLDWDLNKISPDQARAMSSASCTVKGSTRRLDGFCGYFTVFFPDGSSLDTSPASPSTHWKQSLFFLQGPDRFTPQSDLDFTCEISPSGGNARYLDVTLTWKTEQREGCKRFRRIG